MSTELSPAIQRAAANIDTLFCDVDGVLTDGALVYHDGGGESKSFNVKDGYAIRRWIDVGHRFVIITARSSPVLRRRCEELSIETLVEGCQNKTVAAETFLQQHGGGFDRSAYIGDDVPDVGPMGRCVIAATPADGARDAVEAADWVLATAGGRGAVREWIETVLRWQHRWHPG